MMLSEPREGLYRCLIYGRAPNGHLFLGVSALTAEKASLAKIEDTANFGSSFTSILSVYLFI